MIARSFPILLTSVAILLGCEAGFSAEPKPLEAFETLAIRGRVVWLSEAIAKRHNVHEVPEAAERVLALATDRGELHPLVEDVRGRAFRRDKRLREIDIELLVRRYRGSPFVQVIRAYEVQRGELLELDYWCEICAIAMFELKDCECCQGPIELRKRRATDEVNKK